MTSPGFEVPTAPALLQEATSRAGKQEWDDLGFVETLELLLDSCEETARLNPLGWKVLRKVLLRHLRNRLDIQHYVKANPEVVGRGLVRPVVVTGLPRTGTTLLHNLLALDPANRALRLWEALRPVPAGWDGGPSRSELIDQARSWLDQLYALVPDFQAIHRLTPEGPEECDALLQNTFASQHFEDMFRVEAYSSWLRSADLSSEYAYYRLQLQVLGNSGGQSGPWVLKSPSHLGHLDSLLAACPDAVVVHCHRDPLAAIASYASLVFTIRQPYSDDVSPLAAGAHARSRSEAVMGRALAFRASASPGSFVDVDYSALVTDPGRAVAELYEHLGCSFSGDFEARTRLWLEGHQQHRHGVHRYSLDQFGLSAEGIRTAFEAYLSRFPSAEAAAGSQTTS